ncbi:type II toxin-antitoxin system death-on-curing family toxin [Sporosarcina limicola]|uniref:Death-on-curing protein n=1 Tax=Sporosarcina limicola TaxID=34101 RepID=A0A927ML39_9BACL|nr:type II toxin-antitoxin system death-on-curing family toxin [Sporosarcina limicola]MBE1556714.1 death-on-curing protein [Sporosarcina limicola]
MTRFITEKEALMLNALVIKRYTPAEPIGVKDRTLLDSALNRPQQSLFGEDAYPSIWEKAATLYASLSQNHAFHNANKRTSFAATFLFLKLNGCQLRASEKEAEDFTVYLVTEKPSLTLITEWLQKHSDDNHLK